MHQSPPRELCLNKGTGKPSIVLSNVELYNDIFMNPTVPKSLIRSLDNFLHLYTWWTSPDLHHWNHPICLDGFFHHQHNIHNPWRLLLGPWPSGQVSALAWLPRYYGASWSGEQLRRLRHRQQPRLQHSQGRKTLKKRDWGSTWSCKLFLG